MSNDRYVSSAMAVAALEFVPPLMRESLLDDPQFMRDYDLRTEALLRFGNAGVSFQRTQVFDAVRQTLAGTNDLEISDTNGQMWKLKNQTQSIQQPTLALILDDQRLALPEFAMLSPDAAVRLNFLDRVAFDLNLPSNSIDSWREILVERALNDDEVERFQRDIYDTPAYVMGAIRAQTQDGKSTVSSLVPSSRVYFARLVGAYDGSASLSDYAKGTGRQHIEQLAKWRPIEGFLHGLVLSSHSALTAELNIKNLKGYELDRAFEYVENHGDMLSKLGAIEVGLRVLPEYPTIEPTLVRLTEQVRDDDVNGPASEVKLLFAIFVLVDGEIARTRLLCTEPPFYRRLAALAHAALVCRQLLSSDIVIDEVCEWALRNRFEQYFMQSLADMRLEPRWNPNLFAADQLKAGFCTRIATAASDYCRETNIGPLYDLILGAEDGSVRSSIEIPTQFLPSPLEGSEATPSVLPNQLANVIKDQLNTSGVGPSSFFALVNSALMFSIDSEIAAMAANALKLDNYRLSNIQDRSQLLTILNGLAAVAAVARNHELADELRITSRVYRQDPRYSLSCNEEMHVCLVASASRSDLVEWRDVVGDWLTELSFSVVDRNEAVVFQYKLKCLCHAQPDLWISSAGADAALMALIGC